MFICNNIIRKPNYIDLIKKEEECFFNMNTL
jgi:hypothetical protein